jgi:hypothetical protein
MEEIMRRRIAVAGLVVALTASMPLAGPEDQRAGPSLAAGAGAERVAVEQRDWDWKGRIDRGKYIEIKGVNGEIRAERASGREVEVHARLRGKKSDPESVKMEVVEHNDGVTICAVYPSGDRGGPNTCRPGGRGKMSVRKNDVQVDFTVRVPAGVGFIGRTVNGDVEALGLESDVKVRTVNGGIDISTTGLAEASTVNGSITASMEKADWRGTLEFTTVNGNVTLELPDDVNSEVSVSTVNGRISSDFPLTVKGRFSPRRLKGTIGSGGRTLVVKTVNGNVQLRRA